jgi:hypothetical protein
MGLDDVSLRKSCGAASRVMVHCSPAVLSMKFWKDKLPLPTVLFKFNSGSAGLSPSPVIFYQVLCTKSESTRTGLPLPALGPPQAFLRTEKLMAGNFIEIHCQLAVPCICIPCIRVLHAYKNLSGCFSCSQDLPLRQSPAIGAALKTNLRFGFSSSVG